MILKHQYFQLDTESRKVFDENNKELVLTGNAYRLLVFLCEKNNVTITEINEHFDPAGAKDYTENHIRQYRYKINSIIGHNIAEYKNNIYSINGGIKKYQNKIDFEKTNPEIQKMAEDTFKKGVKEKTISPIPKNNKRLLKKNTLIISILVIFLIIFSIIVIKNKKVNTTVSQKSNIAVETTNTSPKPQDDMVLIPAGDFLMGSTGQQALDAFKKCEEQNGCVKNDYLAEYPQHKVSVPDFYIDRKEVSNADYKIFIDATQHGVPSFWNDSNLNSPNQPVVGVNFDDASAYCQWIRKRLPNEVEWEKAARGTDGRIWPWGNTWDNMKDNHGKGGAFGYDETDGFKYTAPVGSELGVSPYGVLNMAGNVWEWTTGDFAPYPGNDKFNNDNFNKGFKILKGGAFDEDQTQQRPASRYEYDSSNKDSDIGFRCAKDK